MSRNEIQDLGHVLELVKKWGTVAIALLSFVSSGVVGAIGWGWRIESKLTNQDNQLANIASELSIARKDIAEIKVDRRETLKEWHMWREAKNIKDADQDGRLAHLER